MKWILRCTPSPATAMALAALVVAVGGVAYATIPDSSGTIHGCFSNTNGILRVVESANDCRTSERAIEWNQEGPPGPPGRPTTAFAEETAEVSTASRSFVDLGGPELNVTVPASGLVAAVARAETHGTHTPPGMPQASFLGGCVGLFVDSQPYLGADRSDSSAELFCQQGNLVGDGVLTYFKNFVDWFTFEASPGPHTFSLRYRARCLIASEGCPEDARGFFKNRKLWVTPIG